jgi:putative addiction module CopG family antidote
MPAKSLKLSAESQRFIAGEIKAGRYRDEKEVLQAGLTLLEEQTRRERMKEALRKEIQIGIDQLDAGLGKTMKTRAELTAHLKGLERKALKGLRKKQVS